MASTIGNFSWRSKGSLSQATRAAQTQNHQSTSDIPVALADVRVGQVFWNRELRPGLRTIKCVRENHCQGLPMDAQAYGHPLLVVEVPPSEEDVISDLGAPVRVLGITSFREMTLAEWRLSRRPECKLSIPIVNSDSQIAKTGRVPWVAAWIIFKPIDYLSLLYGRLSKQSYVQTNHIYEVPISQLRHYICGPTTDDTVRLTRSSYERLMAVLGLKPDLYDKNNSSISDRATISEHNGELKSSHDKALVEITEYDSKPKPRSTSNLPVASVAPRNPPSVAHPELSSEPTDEPCPDSSATIESVISPRESMVQEAEVKYANSCKRKVQHHDRGDWKRFKRTQKPVLPPRGCRKRIKRHQPRYAALRFAALAAYQRVVTGSKYTHTDRQVIPMGLYTTDIAEESRNPSDSSPSSTTQTNSMVDIIEADSVAPIERMYEGDPRQVAMIDGSKEQKSTTYTKEAQTPQNDTELANDEDDFEDFQHSVDQLPKVPKKNKIIRIKKLQAGSLKDFLVVDVILQKMEILHRKLHGEGLKRFRSPSPRPVLKSRIRSVSIPRPALKFVRERSMSRVCRQQKAAHNRKGTQRGTILVGIILFFSFVWYLAWCSSSLGALTDEGISYSEYREYEGT